MPMRWLNLWRASVLRSCNDRRRQSLKRYIVARWKEVGIKVMPVVASVAMAKPMTRAGADALIAEGGEAGGHVGDLTTPVLVPQVCEATHRP